MIISAYTPDYKAYADRLAQSLDKYELKYKFYKYDSTGKWATNTQYKSYAIYSALIEFNEFVWWLDADCEIISMPKYIIDGIDCDIAYHQLCTTYNSAELVTGVVGFGNTDKAKEILTTWQTINSKKPKQWDQRNLAAALCTVKDICSARIPIQYFYIMGHEKYQGVIENPVAKHYQASRQHRN